MRPQRLYAFVWILGRIVVYGGERRSKLEALLEHVTRLEGFESKVEESELNEIARAMVRGKSHSFLAENRTVHIFLPEIHGIPHAGLLSSLYVRNHTISKLSLQSYLARQSKEESKKKKASTNKGNDRKRNQRIFLKTKPVSQLNWGSGGFSLLGRLLGLPFIPVRIVYESLRLFLIRGLTIFALTQRSKSAVQTLDTILKQGPFKAIPRLFPAFDLARSSRFAKYYHFLLRYTKSPRHALRVAWRTPADLTRNFFSFALKRWYLRERHQRLEAVLLRAAANETKRYLELIKPIRQQLQLEKNRDPFSAKEL